MTAANQNKNKKKRAKAGKLGHCLNRRLAELEADNLDTKLEVI
jgi:hypothetical protein